MFPHYKFRINKEIKFKKIIYYCLDNLSSGYNDSEKIAAYEKIFITKSDLNFFTSRKLKEQNYIKGKSFLLPAGVNLDNFKKKRKINKSKNKIIGYIDDKVTFLTKIYLSIATSLKIMKSILLDQLSLTLKNLKFQKYKIFQTNKTLTITEFNV